MPEDDAAERRSRIFISYRREDTEPAYGMLADDLCKHFAPEQVFQDIASIDPGADFIEVRYLQGRRLLLHPRKTAIQATREAAPFLGMVLLAGGRRRLPEENVRRFRNRLRGLRDRWRAGTITQEQVEQRVGAWIAHAEHADTWRLRRAIFRGGWFDPMYAPP